MTDAGGLIDALKRAGIREVDASTRRRAEYSSDASNYRVVPQVVVFPRHRDEVGATLDVCRAAGVALTSRGGGTSIAGNAVGPGVVLDFSRHLNKVRSINPESQLAIVEPGVILDDLQAQAAPHGLRFGPDPSTHARCTIGGMIGNNACGSRALAYGKTADNVNSLDVITGSGVAFTARSYGRDGLTSVTGPERAILANLARDIDAQRALIRTEFGRFDRQVSGYSLEHLLPENAVHLARMMSGTEGTPGRHDRGLGAAGPGPEGSRAGRAGLCQHGIGRRRRAGSAAAQADRAGRSGRPDCGRHPSAQGGVGGPRPASR